MKVHLNQWITAGSCWLVRESVRKNLLIHRWQRIDEHHEHLRAVSARSLIIKCLIKCYLSFCQLLQVLACCDKTLTAQFLLRVLEDVRLVFVFNITAEKPCAKWQGDRKCVYLICWTSRTHIIAHLILTFCQGLFGHAGLYCGYWRVEVKAGCRQIARTYW